MNWTHRNCFYTNFPFTSCDKSWYSLCHRKVTNCVIERRMLENRSVVLLVKIKLDQRETLSRKSRLQLRCNQQELQDRNDISRWCEQSSPIAYNVKQHSKSYNGHTNRRYVYSQESSRYFWPLIHFLLVVCDFLRN